MTMLFQAVIRMRCLLRPLGVLTAVLVLGSLPACAGTTPDSLEVGLEQSEVSQLLGEPAAQQQFQMPTTPFFGPQEALTRIVPAGDSVLEWQYERGSEILYLWFSRAEGAGDHWQLVHWLEAPADAVY